MVFWVGLSNCFLFVLLNSQYIFEMVMPVQHAAKVYKSIWDVFSARVFGEYVMLLFFFFSSQRHRRCRRRRSFFVSTWMRFDVPCWVLEFGVCVNLNTLNGNAEANRANE